MIIQNAVTSKMGKSLITFLLAIFSLATAGLASQNFNERRIRGVVTNPKYKTPMHKALFTQRGYIQFLRWELPVPEIEEFTFCLWVKSTNLTYSHSIFSYSKNEEKRLVRSWISPFGRSIHLEIGEIEILAHPTRFKEHRWYHVCQSWENRLSRYGLWIDGRKEIEGYATELENHVIPSMGDIVVGQEYTDFDKGFEEGIEGAVVGFNLLLASAFEKPRNFIHPIKHEPRGTSRFVLAKGIERTPIILTGPKGHPEFQLRKSDEYIPSSLNQNYENNREGIFESTLKEYLGEGGLFDRNLKRRSDDGEKKIVVDVKLSQKIIRRDTATGSDKRIKRQLENESPLGLQLVDLSYNHCEIGRGSPFIGGSKMLISWTRTPVKVFGGAILKNVKNTCGDF